MNRPRIARAQAPGAPRQHSALRYIARLYLFFKEPPTRAELGRELGVTKVTAHLLVRKLQRDGLVAVVPRKHRGIKLKPAAWRALAENQHG